MDGDHDNEVTLKLGQSHSNPIKSLFRHNDTMHKS